MMTQQQLEQQEFDAISYELKHEKDFQALQHPYVEPNYEIDSSPDEFGSLYRVWSGRILLGTFYRKHKQWVSSPYYQNRQYLRLDKSLDKTFRSNELAIRHIIDSYEGC
ncbi:hypothetical protein H1P_3720005 [Hyella patelloides LEGE 07179]|uniref:Uncharacterized protein n=1 Tax=Hyella patelloides LEGE 07179 TaxID=945734 RepID=A0A563VWL0_9CYAN|nr:hypothetical protein [Hyella patelloides]VEP15806.1 hypothetical protein H1P_3720005 [Hyella patelloides LEGE 07179]